MASIKYFEHKFTVNTSLDQVAAFHEDPKTLKALTPPPMIVTFNKHTLDTEEDLIDFNLWFGPLPIRWVAGITQEDSSPGFVDRQIEGPFDFWEHKHIFRKIDNQSTLIIDQIMAQHVKNIFKRLISQSMWLTLPILFAFRAWRTRRILEKNPS
jgi:ligand-binding SRPBCC domain-containing protein